MPPMEAPFGTPGGNVWANAAANPQTQSTAAKTRIRFIGFKTFAPDYIRWQPGTLRRGLPTRAAATEPGAGRSLTLAVLCLGCLGCLLTLTVLPVIIQQ